MNNDDLDRLLKSAVEPGRPTEYWDVFPEKIVSNLDGRRSFVREEGYPKSTRAALTWFALGAGMATACLILAFVFQGGRRRGVESFTAADIAVMRKYLQEVEALFPNQVQAVVFEPGGPRLVLADRPVVPATMPVYVRVCGEHECQSFLTFSGQQIRLNGEVVDVLVDARGNVLLVGTRLSWTSGQSNSRVGSLRIVARSLESTS